MIPDLRHRLWAIAFALAYGLVEVQVIHLDITPGCRCWHCRAQI